MMGDVMCMSAKRSCMGIIRSIPHPAEWQPIGNVCLFCNCHTHKKFDLVVSVHEAENLPRGAKVYLYAEAGRFDGRTQECRVDDKSLKADFYERLRVHIRQMDENITFTVYKKLALSSEEVGSVTLEIVKDLIEPDFPSNRWYQLEKEGKKTSKVQLSFIQMDGGSEGMSPLLMQAMVQAQMEAAASGETAPQVDFVNMEPKPRLVLLSKALEGPLKMMKGIGLKSWSSFYFRAVEVKSNEWEWQFWADKKICQEGGRRLGRIRMLGISNVLADPGNRHSFYVKYHDSKGTHDLMFMRVDRDRDVWSDGLYEFIDRLRDYLDKYRKPQTKVDSYLTSKKKISAPKAVPLDPNSRRAVVATGKDQSVPKAPKALAAMAAEMYETDDEDDHEEIEPDWSGGDDSDDDDDERSPKPEALKPPVSDYHGGTGSSMDVPVV